MWCQWADPPAGFFAEDFSSGHQSRRMKTSVVLKTTPSDANVKNGPSEKINIKNTFLLCLGNEDNDANIQAYKHMCCSGY